MNNALLRIYAATALDSIIKADGTSYANMNRSALCSRIQEQHAEIEKEIAFALAGVWAEIKEYERANVFRRIWLRMVQTLRNRNGSVGIPIHVLESIVDTMLPDIVAFFETDEGKREFEEWKAERRRAENAPHSDAMVDKENGSVNDPAPLKNA
jgi:hypothetical protein